MPNKKVKSSNSYKWLSLSQANYSFHNFAYASSFAMISFAFMNQIFVGAFGKQLVPSRIIGLVIIISLALMTLSALVNIANQTKKKSADPNIRTDRRIKALEVASFGFLAVTGLLIVIKPGIVNNHMKFFLIPMIFAGIFSFLVFMHDWAKDTKRINEEGSTVRKSLGDFAGLLLIVAGILNLFVLVTKHSLLTERNINIIVANSLSMVAFGFLALSYTLGIFTENKEEVRNSELEPIKHLVINSNDIRQLLGNQQQWGSPPAYQP
ncbi:MAG: hypothetical protein HRK26_01385 [Rickettsiaceae bacterium H1]|nr:hypothetical protein [Rickettsiaceae bacterium H1]